MKITENRNVENIMERMMKLLARLVIVALAVAMTATSPGASSEHFVVTNNIDASGPNTGTIFELAGSYTNPVLHHRQTLNTGVTMGSGGLFPSVVFANHGPDVCLFLADPQDIGNEISAFVYSGLTLTGNYNDPSIAGSGMGIALAARGNFLFASYGNNGTFAIYLDVWRIRSGCALELLSTTPVTYPIVSLAATPDGKTVVVTYYTEVADLNGVGSFSVSPNGDLVEHGPYGIPNGNSTSGVDITADSKYALIAVGGVYPTNDEPFVAVFAINADGSLGQQYDFGGEGQLGPGLGTGSLVLSPDERFIYINPNVGTTVSTLTFSESSLRMGWAGCMTTLRVPKGEEFIDGGGLVTAFPTGSGVALYAVEDYDFASIGLLTIDPNTGCTTEAPGSPFLTGKQNLWSVGAWPKRPF